MSDAHLSSKVVKIRKPCKCFGCGLYSLVGQQMTKEAAVYDGEFCVSALCMTCTKIRDSFARDDREDGFYEGELMDDAPYEWMRVHREVLGLEPLPWSGTYYDEND